MTGWRIGTYVSVGTLDRPQDIVMQGPRKMEAANCACKSYLHSPSLPVICLIQARFFKYSGTVKGVDQ